MPHKRVLKITGIGFGPRNQLDMKYVIALAVLSATCVISHGALSCLFDENACAEDECCVKIGLIVRCQPKLNEESVCSKRPITHLFRKHVYKLMCPCKDGLQCRGDLRIIGKFVGRCTADGTDDNNDDDYDDSYDDESDDGDDGWPIGEDGNDDGTTD